MDQADVDLAIFVAEDVTELAQGGQRDVGRYLSHPRFADLDHRFGHTLDAAFDHIDPHLVRREIGVVARPDIGQCIVDILQRHFGLIADGAKELVVAAVQKSRKSVGDFAFTRQVLRDYDLGQRMLLAELLWQVVLTDGSIDSNDSYLMRKLANLLQLDPAFLSESR